MRIENTGSKVQYKNIRTRIVEDISPRIGMELDTAYSRVGADALIEFVNKWLEHTDVEMVKKKKGGKK